ncbi:Uncharacterised protein [Escherichia coli]|uniref:Uncharacterized protein n=1 Tax=Escherichia coli TaxID=562 RepID=A0A376ZWT5_ECOLX|nr:Uncharacterised protein [Escherichia coli]
MYFIRRRIIIHFEFILEISTGYSRFNNYFKTFAFNYRPFGRPPDVLRVQKSLRLRIKFLTELNLIIQFLDFVALRIRAFALRSI